MGKTVDEANAVLDFIFGDGSYSPPATWYCGLLSDADTEVSGGSYARVAKTRNATHFPDAVDGTKSNGTLITFPTLSADIGEATHFGWFDASTAGNLRYTGELAAPLALEIGITPEFAIGEMIWAET